MRVYVVETGAPIAHQSIAIKITSNACHCSRSGHAASAGMIVSEPSVFNVTSSEADTMTRQVIEREGDCSIKSDSSQCEIDHIAWIRLISLSLFLSSLRSKIIIITALCLLGTRTPFKITPAIIMCSHRTAAVRCYETQWCFASTKDFKLWDYVFKGWHKMLLSVTEEPSLTMMHTNWFDILHDTATRSASDCTRCAIVSLRYKMIFPFASTILNWVILLDIHRILTVKHPTIFPKVC